MTRTTAWGLRPARQRSDGHGGGRLVIADLDHRVRERGFKDNVSDELGSTRGCFGVPSATVCGLKPAGSLIRGHTDP